MPAERRRGRVPRCRERRRRPPPPRRGTRAAAHGAYAAMRVRLRSSCLRVALSVLGRVFPGRQTVTVSLVPYTYADTTPARQKEEVSPGRQRRTKPKRPSRCCGRLSRVVRSRCVAAGDTGGNVAESPEQTDPRRIV